MKQSFFLFFVFFSNIVFAQNYEQIEILKKQASNYTEHDQINSLNLLVDEILKPSISKNNSEQALPYAIKALNYSENLKYNYGITRSLKQLIAIQNELGNKTAALKYKTQLMTTPKGTLIRQKQEEILNKEKELALQKEELKRTENELELKRLEAERIKFENQQLGKSNKESQQIIIKNKNELNRKDSVLNQVEGMVQVLVEEKEMLAMQNKLLKQESEIKELIVESQKLQNKFLIGIAIFVFLISVILLFLYRTIKGTSQKLKDKNKIIEEEIKKSDELLLNILPVETANELKLTGKARARKYDKVTVLITDFKDFTIFGQKLNPEQLVEEIDLCFSAFDAITTKYGIEKIKTIGDAYLCAQGLPTGAIHNPIDAINAAKEMIQFVNDMKIKRESEGSTFFSLRIGIHTGPLVAGVVGQKKFAYDIWGDTVNTAARMEQNGEPGKINVSGETFELIKNNFNCFHRGKISAKNKGEIDMYFVE